MKELKIHDLVLIDCKNYGSLNIQCRYCTNGKYAMIEEIDKFIKLRLLKISECQTGKCREITLPSRFIKKIFDDFTVYLNIYDLDDTLLYPTPYRLLFFFDDIQKQNEIAKSEDFQELLKYGNVAPWLQTSEYKNLLEYSGRVFIVTGRWNYNETITRAWLENIDFYYDDIFFVNFSGMESYYENKLDVIDKLIKKYPRMIPRIIEDSEKLIDMIHERYDCDLNTVLISHGKLSEIKRKRDNKIDVLKNFRTR